jgi:hypothetical protein
MEKRGVLLAKITLLVCFVTAPKNILIAQSGDCTFRSPFFLMHFGKGNVRDVNTTSLALYNRVSSSCPPDGYFAYTAYTGNCFQGDWHTLYEDHTPGDADGNMLLVNSALDKGLFLRTRIKGFKSGTTYQFGVWLMNVCKPSDKCPSPLLPNLNIRVQTLSGKTLAQFLTGDLPRTHEPNWTQHRAQFIVPVFETELIVSMINNAPGGCGNDFALDDITFSECVKPERVKKVELKKVLPVILEKKHPLPKKEVLKVVPQAITVKEVNQLPIITKSKKVPPLNERLNLNPQPVDLVPIPLILKQRANPLIKQIETSEGLILLDLYDNGEIDDDTVSIYHNNKLIISGQRLSQKPISFQIRIDKNQPHHELVMVANNLGSIPPNTSVMIVTAKDKRYQVFITATDQQNAKVVIYLKE